MSEETIAAIATPLGMGGIGVVRISGEDALVCAERCVRTVRGEPLSQMRGYTCAFGRVFDAEGDVDETVATVFRAPHSFTGEDTVELSCHGGVYLLERVLRACLSSGARLARPGEFTHRAFLNGKLDLTRAEAVIDLISAQGKQAARAALTARDGALFQRIGTIAEKLIEEAAHLAAWIDYPEEEISEVDPDALLAALHNCAKKLRELLGTYDAGKLIREGIETAIVGRPNVGKSTLMNLLAGYRRSIVADQPGTTRDVVSDTVRLGGLVLHLADTAGIRGTLDPIEQAGVAFAEERLNRAQLVLAVFDGSDALNEDDKRVIAACQGAVSIALINKNDLPQQLDAEQLRSSFKEVITLSAKQAEGAERLTAAIEKLFRLGQFDSSAAMVANERQRACVSAAEAELTEAAEALRAGISYDAVCVCVERAIDSLLELTGKRASQEVVDQVFSRFCVGK